MPSFSEVKQYLGGQIAGNPFLPKVDLTGKTYIITGANTGLGLECAKYLAQLNASKIILGCRNLTKGASAKEAIPKLCPTTNVEVWEIDQSNFQSVLAFGSKIKFLERLDGFIANAGLETITFEKTEGYENQLTVNVISTTLVSLLALPKLQETAKMTGKHTNLEIVGSMQHVFAPFNHLLDAPEDKNIFEVLSTDITRAEMQGRYELSKLMMQQIEREIASRLPNPKNGGVVVNCVNPGWCQTELSRYYDKGKTVGMIFSMIGRSAEDGAKCLVHGVTAGEESHGMYLSECLVKEEGNFVKSVEGEEVQGRLWRDVMEIIGGLSLDVREVIEGL